MENNRPHQETKTFAWQEALAQLADDDGLLLYSFLRRAVVGHKAVLSNREQLLTRVGDGYRDDLVQIVAEKLIKNNYLDEWMDSRCPDETISRIVWAVVRNLVLDLLKRKWLIAEVSSLEGSDRRQLSAPAADTLDSINDGEASDFISPLDRLELKELEAENLKLLQAVTCRLNDRRKFILKHYQKFGGEMKQEELAKTLHVSVHAISKNVDKIRKIVREEIVQHRRVLVKSGRRRSRL